MLEARGDFYKITVFTMQDVRLCQKDLGHCPSQLTMMLGRTCLGKSCKEESRDQIQRVVNAKKILKNH